MRNKGNNKPEIDEVMIIKEEHTNRGQWKLGRIVSLIEENDGVTRGATVRVISGGNPREIQRPVQKLYPLEINCQPEDS